MEEQVQNEQTPREDGGERRFSKKPQARKGKKVCQFCIDKTFVYVDYKNANFLRKFMTERGKIVSRRQTGLCAKHQREVTTAVKRARNMSLV